MKMETEEKKSIDFNVDEGKRHSHPFSRPEHSSNSPNSSIRSKKRGLKAAPRAERRNIKSHVHINEMNTSEMKKKIKGGGIREVKKEGGLQEKKKGKEER